MNATATVEVLTAEVRVLMVGSRQVTLSVYAQLDEVSPDDIEPFGRVAPRSGNAGRVYVVGKQTETGSLARSSTYSSAAMRPPSLKEIADAGPASGTGVDVERLTNPVLYATQNFAEDRAAREDWPPAAREAFADLWHRCREEIARRSQAAETARVWEGLPLIVLAGLR